MLLKGHAIPHALVKMSFLLVIFEGLNEKRLPSNILCILIECHLIWLAMIKQCAWIYKQNLTDVVKQLKHNCPPAYNIPSVSPVIYCSALSYLRLASDHVGIFRQLIG